MWVPQAETTALADLIRRLNRELQERERAIAARQQELNDLQSRVTALGG